MFLISKAGGEGSGGRGGLGGREEGVKNGRGKGKGEETAWKCGRKLLVGADRGGRG